MRRIGILLGLIVWAGLGTHAGARGIDSPFEARLSLSTPLPHWVHADASASFARVGHVEFYRFWVTDEARDGRLVRGPVETDGGHYYVALPAGRYRVHVQVGGSGVQDDEAETGSDTASSTVDVVNSTTVLSTTTSETTATCSTSGSFVTCTLSTDDGTTTIDLAELATQVGASDTNTLWFEAWGARGGDGGSSIKSGGKAGDGGNAVTITTVSDFKSRFGTTTIHYYVGRDGSHKNSAAGGGGGGGGSSTVVATVAASGSMSLGKVVLIAGGGGGGGGADSNPGHDGGAAGCALAISDSGSAVTGGGHDGSGTDPGGGGDGAKGGSLGGGNQDGGSTAGSGGIGGNGGTATTDSQGWLNGSPDFGSNGLGGNGDAGGGGGYGGGGATSNDYAGGGGGGSYAMSATQTNLNAPTSCSGMNGNGVIHIVFDLET